MPRDALLAPPLHVPRHPQLPCGKGGAVRMGEGIFLLFLTLAAPDYHVLRSEPRKHHSAMLQLGWLPSAARGRRRGAAGRGCERTSVCTRGPRDTASFSPSRCGMQPAAPRTGRKGRLLPANVFVFLVRLLIRLGLIAFESVAGFLGGFFWLSP